MLRPANVLVLDEPTNDLDLATLDVLRGRADQLRRRGAAGDPRPLLPGSGGHRDPGLSHHARRAGPAGRLRRPGAVGGLARQPGRRPRAARATPSRRPPSRPGKRKKLGFKDQRDWEAIEGRIAAAEAAPGGAGGRVRPPGGGGRRRPPGRAARRRSSGSAPTIDAPLRPLGRAGGAGDRRLGVTGAATVCFSAPARASRRPRCAACSRFCGGGRGQVA